MLPLSTPVLPSDSRPRNHELLNDDESFTEEYGEMSGGSRTLGGGVDFFSSLGTERKKALRPDKPDPEKVPALLPNFLLTLMCAIFTYSLK